MNDATPVPILQLTITEMTNAVDRQAHVYCDLFQILWVFFFYFTPHFIYLYECIYLYGPIVSEINYSIRK